jgi:autotransporter-associated beta strand protein
MPPVFAKWAAAVVTILLGADDATAQTTTLGPTTSGTITVDATSGQGTVNGSSTLNGSVSIGLGFKVEYLVVGGGGAGSYWTDGGGGAGGAVQTGSAFFSPGSYVVSVGSGGPGQGYSSLPNAGGRSSFAGVNADGGGAGAYRWLYNGTYYYSQVNGGSGGGSTSGYTAGSPTGNGSGHGGGNGYYYRNSFTGATFYSGGGGGGAVSNGGSGDGNTGGNGGEGVASSISGASVFYGGGGGGAGKTTGGSGGSGGGGRGYSPSASATRGTHGVGGGGGGGGGWGGNGIVIARYLGAQIAIGGSASAGAGSATGYTVHTFQYTGPSTSFQIPSLDDRLSATVTASLSGNGSLDFRGPGILSMSGVNTYSGGTTVSGGTLIGNTDSVPGSIRNDSRLIFDQSTTGTYAGLLSGSGSFTKMGGGTVVLTGTSTHSGGTTVSSGSLIGSTPSLQGAIVNNAAVTFDQATSGTFSGTMAGVGSFTKKGAGTLYVQGLHTHSGPTNVQAGTLSLSGTLANSAVEVGLGGTLGGSGFIGSSLTILAGGTLAPGNSPGRITTNALTLLDRSTTIMEIVGLANGSGSLAGVAGTDYDTIDVVAGGPITYGGTLLLSFSNTSHFANGSTFELFSFSGTHSGAFSSVRTAGSGEFASLIFTSNVDGSWYTPDTAGGQYLKFSPLTGDLVVVPEPSTSLMALMTAGAAWGTQRCRKRFPRRTFPPRHV